MEKLVVGMCIGFSMGAGVAMVVSGIVKDWLGVRRTLAELDREIAADKVTEAKQYHQAEACRLIRQNRQEAQRAE
jgi:formylmethanofuran dehydrogenase subunit C